MNHDSFKHIESLFHELSELDAHASNERLNTLSETDPSKAQSLRVLLGSITEHPSFLDPSAVDAMTPASVDIPLDGTVILGDRYTLVERIGVGGSSTVFRAHASDPKRDVAIKMLRIGFDSQQIRDRFALESHALASLTHPHIAHVYQTGVHVCNGIQVPWIAMELISGSQTIIDYANTNALDPNARIDLFMKVCEAVQGAHQSGVLHLDLNASNILIDAHGYPKIIDFGLFGILNSLSRKTPIHVGTRISMAPEQTIFQSGAFDERTDIYALGLLLTELLTGTQLQRFPGVSTEHALRLIALGKARELLSEVSQIPRPLSDTIDTSIRVNPDDRYQSITELLHAIQHGRVSIEKASKPRRKTSLQLVGVLAALALASLLFVQLQRPRPVETSESQSDTSEETISIPRQLAIDLTSQNPRTSQYSPRQSEILEGVGSIVESDPAQTPEEQADLLAKLADRHRVSGDYDKAIEYYQKSIQLLKESNLPADYNWVLLSLIQTHIFLEHIDQAQHALELVDRTTNLSLLFRVDLSLAESAVHVAMNRREEAIRQAKYTETLINELKVEDERVRIERLLNLATVYEASAEYRSAASTLRNAKTIAQKAGAPSSVEIALINLKIGINDAPDATPDSLDQVIDQIQRAVVRLMESGDGFHAAWGLRQLGNVQLRSGQFNRAADSYSKSHAHMVRLLGDDHHESISCRAYELIARHANGDDSPALRDEFTNTLSQLSHTLGQNHSMIRSLQSDWDQLYLWDSKAP